MSAPGEGDVVFYEPKAPYYGFSNFYPSPFELHGHRWDTVEQYFQAHKFYVPESEAHMAYFRAIGVCDSPMKVKMLGTQSKKTRFPAQLEKWVLNKKTDTRRLVDVIDANAGVCLRADWEAAKEGVMKEGLRAKFSSNPTLANLLLSTGERRIVENSPRDSYWGIGKDGRGKNRLGALLMEVREELRTGHRVK
jgi:predicted NAD-dependent protein-ADP-ribosyltransferase YbiA (DUF1768 family)